MKRLTMIIAMILILSSMLYACGRRDSTPSSNPSDTTASTSDTTRATENTTAPTMPITDPTLDTNIPDPTVDSNSNEGIIGDMDPTDSIGNGGMGSPME